MSRAQIVALLALGACAVGCDHGVALQAITSPPPLAQAQIDTSGEVPVIRLTKGVALAVSCTDAIDETACTGMTVRISDPSVASVSNGYLADWGDSTAVMVIVGVSVGRTTLTVTANEGSTQIPVDVINL